MSNYVKHVDRVVSQPYHLGTVGAWSRLSAHTKNETSGHGLTLLRVQFCPARAQPGT